MINMMPAADTPSSPVSPRHRRSRLRRLLRFVLFSFLALLFLLFSAVLVLRLLYPPARIKAMINEAAIEKLDRRLSLRKVWLHPLRGFILEEVSLSPYPDSTSGYDLFVLRQFHARQIAVRYSLRDIFKNKLHLREIEIVGPEMEFFVDMLDTTLIDFAALARTELPLTLDLRSLRLRDSRIRVVLADTLTRQEFFIGDLDAVLKDVRLPGGGFLRNDSALQADLAIRCQATPLSLSQSDLRSGSTLRLEALLDLDTRLSLRSYHDLRLALGLQLRELVYEEEAPGSVRRTAFRPRLNLALGLHGDGHIGSAHLDSLILALDGRRWLVAEGAAEGLYGQGRFSARLSHGEIPSIRPCRWRRSCSRPAGSLICSGSRRRPPSTSAGRRSRVRSTRALSISSPSSCVMPASPSMAIPSGCGDWEPPSTCGAVSCPGGLKGPP